METCIFRENHGKMPKIILNRKRVQVGQPVFTGEKREEALQAQLFSYTEANYNELNPFNHSQLESLPQHHKNWLNVYGIHDEEAVKNICKVMNIHDLVIQDILDVNQRPKVQEYEDYCFFTFKSMIPIEQEVAQEQISFVLGEDYLISFQEKKADYFEHVRERIRGKIGKVRGMGSDYLLYLLLEAILDNYFKTLNEVDTKAENLGLFEMDRDPSPNVIKLIEFQKRQVHQIKKTIIPIREFVVKLEREPLTFISPESMKYFFELKDLALSLLDHCEHLEVKLESNINMFFSVQGHRMNQVMKILTVVSSIFIPLTFLAGIYGMNFEHIPELKWTYGYFYFWGLMLIIFVLMIYFFKKKKWF